MSQLRTTRSSNESVSLAALMYNSPPARQPTCVIHIYTTPPPFREIGLTFRAAHLTVHVNANRAYLQRI